MDAFAASKSSTTKRCCCQIPYSEIQNQLCCLFLLAENRLSRRLIVRGDPFKGKAFEAAGAETIVYVTPLLISPWTVTTTLPVVAPVGTTTVTDAEFHRDIVVA